MCSGIEAASVAWHPLGWRAAWLAEIEPFPCAVLAHHYPDVPNLGDMSHLAERIVMGEIEAPDLFCGGTPCQAFSVAGLRQSLDDARGNLSLTFCEIANAIDISRAHDGLKPCIVFWENVPGVLNTKDNAFGCFLAGLAGEDDALVAPGGRWANAGAVFGPQRAVAWRTLDAQYFGLAQRRRRVFVVASARDGFDPAAVLFELDGARRDFAPRREAGEGTAPTLDASFGRLQGCSGQDANHGHGHLIPQAFGGNDTRGPIDAAAALNANRGCHNPGDFEAGTLLVFDTTQITSAANYSNPKPGDPCHPLAAGAHPPAIAFNHNAQSAQLPTAGRDTSINDGLTCPQGAAVAYTTKLHNTASNNAGKVFEERATCLDANSPPPALLTATQVRRLTPVECERLQGFPDNYTAIPWRKKPAEECPDGPRYKALGNSWAVPVVRWIGWRVAAQVWGDLA